jgi:hypothetical protein
VAAAKSFHTLRNQYPPLVLPEEFDLIPGPFEVDQDLITSLFERGNGISTCDLENEIVAKLWNTINVVQRIWTRYALREGAPMLYQESHFLWVDAICIKYRDPN